MKYLKIAFFLFLLIGTIIILHNHNSTSIAPYQVAEGSIFGTQYKVIYQHKQDLKLAVDSTLKAVDQSLSLFNKTSTLARINRGETNRVDSLFAKVFRISTEVALHTNGAFDPTIAPAVNAWGFGPKRKHELNQYVLDSIAELVDFRKVEIIGDSLLSKADDRISLDFGAIAKGYGVDVVAEMLSIKGVVNYMVEIGGEVVVKGVNDKGNAWRIGVQSPTSDEACVQKVIQLNNAALATSGNYRNYYLNDQGVRVAHTIDPRTASPVAHSLLSATVVAPTCALADAYATAFMVMGLDAATEILKHQPQLSAYFIYAQGDSLCVFSTLH